MESGKGAHSVEPRVHAQGLTSVVVPSPMPRSRHRIGEYAPPRVLDGQKSAGFFACLDSRRLYNAAGSGGSARTMFPRLPGFFGTVDRSGGGIHRRGRRLPVSGVVIDPPKAR